MAEKSTKMEIKRQLAAANGRNSHGLLLQLPILLRLLLTHGIEAVGLVLRQLLELQVPEEVFEFSDEDGDVDDVSLLASK